VPLVDALFAFLFKYRLAVFERGDFAVDVSRPVLVALLLAGVLLVALAVLTYRGVRAKGGARHRTLLLALRAAVVALLVYCLARPVLVVAASVPRRNTVGVLVDDSRSMRIRDWDGRARGDFARTALAADSPLLARLGEQFQLRFYRFSALAERVPGPGAADGLGFAGARTSLGAALDRARQDLSDVPVAGLVVVSDGADNAATGPADALLALRASKVPVFTVGVGSETPQADVEVARVDVPRSVLAGTAVTADVVLRHTGLGGAKVPLVVEEGGRMVATREVTLPAVGEALTVRVTVPDLAAGVRRLTVRVPRQASEALAENNARQALVTVADRREKILYYEGEPRFELKFVRRAVEADANLDLVTLQRTAESKYLRLGVTDSLDLVSGFPSTREELFAYRAVVLGSVEASAFTTEQLRMLAEFVSERGGGLLMLGGRRSFAEGGYAGTALADVMPVVLDGEAGESVAELEVHLTPAGAGHAPLQLGATEQASAERWRTLPPLTAVNLVRRAKPGATVLLTGDVAGGSAGRRIVLAYQRYGRGRAAAFPVQDSWLWQMHASIAVDDMSHELFWRQMLRWLVSGTPDRATVTASTDRPAPGERVTVRAELRDAEYRPVDGARVVADVVSPAGERQELPMEWSLERDGEYRASFAPAEVGAYEVRVRAAARDGKDSVAAEPLHLDAADPQDEWFDAGMRAPLLRRVAAETGGRFYTPATVSALPEDLRLARGGVTVVERLALWDMPAVLLLLGGLLATEWACRRAWGLA
jgi:uncharacterized membrane protein